MSNGIKALFLDRDGVINVNHGYVHTKESFDLIEGIFEFVKFAFQNGFIIIVITNPAGVGRGFYSERQFHFLSKWMWKQFADVGAPISRVYYSPYHPTAGKGRYLKGPKPGRCLFLCRCLSTLRGVFRCFLTSTTGFARGGVRDARGRGVSRGGGGSRGAAAAPGKRQHISPHR